MRDYLKKKYTIIDGIKKFEIIDKSTKKVTEFYKISPFPNYKDTDNKITILEKGDKNIIASQFKKFIGYNKNILEVGCGTGQLSMYFSIGTNNKVIGLDPTIYSLNKAKRFAIENNISNVELVNADIFDDVLTDEYFDYVWCNGVLHHTKDPYGAFKILIKCLKKNGYILIGLYNRFGRLRTLIRKIIFKIFGKKIISAIDPTLRNLKISEDEEDAWIRDQYQHPIESLHTIDEICDWFEKNNIDFISSIPSCDFEYDYENIFLKKKKGSIYSRIINQIVMIFNHLGADGGLFVIIGKKK